MQADPLSARSDQTERRVMKPEVFLPDDYRPAEDEPLTARATRNVLARLDAHPELLGS